MDINKIDYNNLMFAPFCMISYCCNQYQPASK